MNENSYGPKDKPRLDSQRANVRELMLDGMFRTLKEIEEATGYPQASISARLRDLRKQRFGSYTVNRIHRGEGAGTWYYQVLEPGFLFPTKTSADISAHI